jgi:hypothetical protein
MYARTYMYSLGCPCLQLLQHPVPRHPPCMNFLSPCHRT